MGLFQSSFEFMDSERKTWIEHDLQYDAQVRQANLNLLTNIRDGSNLSICYVKNSFGGISYQHWFIKAGVYYIEFGSPTLNLYTARVTINLNPRDNVVTDRTQKMDEEIRQRISHVLGMSNYSLCLRNCEHVANYIFNERWLSSQMNPDGILLNTFISYMMDNQRRLINTFPASIRPHIFENREQKLYSFIDRPFTATKFDYYLDWNENTYNILVLGPTGAGKSHLINLIFNQTICRSEVNHKGVTREIYFIRGNGKVYDFDRQQNVTKDILIADTIGLCDTEIEDSKLLKLIKGRINSNCKYIDAVYIVFKADRLPLNVVENIKHVLKWLKYDENNNYTRFQFIATHSESLSDEKKSEMYKQACEMLGLKNTMRSSIRNENDLNSLIYTGFPPENILNDNGKEIVERDFNKLMEITQVPGTAPRISIDTNRLRICTIL